MPRILVARVARSHRPASLAPHDDSRPAPALLRALGAPELSERGPEDAHWVVRDPAWDDLATSKPGAAASARARELRREHPLMTTAADLFGIRSEARAFAIGPGGRTVGRKLDRWADRQGGHVLHAVPVGRSGADIDHVVVGPFGVVTINTKVTGTVVGVGEYGMTIGGIKVDYVRKSRSEAVRARRPRALYRWLRRPPPALAAGQAEAIYQAARRPATWPPPGGR